NGWAWIAAIQHPTQDEINFANSPNVCTLQGSVEATIENFLYVIGNCGADPTAAPVFLMSYAISADNRQILATARLQGPAGNAYTLAAGTGSNAHVSGAKLSGGAGLGDYFLNGQ